MMYVKVADLKSGQILARDIVDERCRILLKAGKEISDAVKNVVSQKGYKGVYVEDFSSSNIYREPMIDVIDEFKLIQILEKIYNNEAYHTDYYNTEFRLSIKSLETEIDSLVDNLCAKKQSGDMIVEVEDMRNFDNWFYWHSLSVCVMSICTGVQMGLDKKSLLELGIASILHDMGKSWLDSELVNKNKLSKEEKKVFHKHPEYMYRVMQNYGYSYKLATGIWSHHEKFDGTGYPNGLRGEKIVDFARIISIADKFDNMLNKGEKIRQSDAIEYLCGSSKYDTNIVKYFIQVVAPYSVGSVVLLSNSTKGTVIRNNVNLPLRPILATRSGILDLTDSKNINITITQII